MTKINQTPYKNIVVCGDIGTGTTTLSGGLSSKIGWKLIIAGDFFRRYHKKHDIPLWDKSKIPDEVERKVDREILEKMKNEEHIVFDSHYGGWFARDLNNVFRILLICDRDVATQRILEREHTHKETAKEIEERRRQLRAKFKKLYSNDNYEDPKYFHLIINTTTANANQTLSTALNAITS
ncbi:MAG: hypothetical protein A2Z11_01460 [Candidatus Woykebacteria bacterium RBG_16_43_9]|uniref:(d)CMP kinase n=1 Tax=Candidatus Woykebacteria bacterium RBG_16_43_9 TaxID=1802596 RepID=A0A1G1WGJ6_9BACT|nr:MAG: hypothetical protein A2Z11_01460 [Candidatus Woykebacteria bacterium RBG_16_43_9]